MRIERERCQRHPRFGKFLIVDQLNGDVEAQRRVLRSKRKSVHKTIRSILGGTLARPEESPVKLDQWLRILGVDRVCSEEVTADALPVGIGFGEPHFGATLIS